jgi:hypothetical protein
LLRVRSRHAEGQLGDTIHVGHYAIPGVNWRTISRSPPVANVWRAISNVIRSMLPIAAYPSRAFYKLGRPAAPEQAMTIGEQLLLGSSVSSLWRQSVATIRAFKATSASHHTVHLLTHLMDGAGNEGTVIL